MPHTEETAEEAVTEFVQLVEDIDRVSNALRLCSSHRMGKALQSRLRRRYDYALERARDIDAEMTELPP